jgi:hypothetical protein
VLENAAGGGIRPAKDAASVQNTMYGGKITKSNCRNQEIESAGFDTIKTDEYFLIFGIG